MLHKNSWRSCFALHWCCSLFQVLSQSLKKSSCCLAFLNSVILQILQCCLSKQLCQLSSLLHWILFWEVQYSSLHMPGPSNSGKETTSRWNRPLKFVSFGFNNVTMAKCVGVCCFCWFFSPPSAAIFFPQRKLVYSTGSFQWTCFWNTVAAGCSFVGLFFFFYTSNICFSFLSNFYLEVCHPGNFFKRKITVL